jgi:hypothetical protein
MPITASRLDPNRSASRPLTQPGLKWRQPASETEQRAAPNFALQRFDKAIFACDAEVVLTAISPPRCGRGSAHVQPICFGHGRNIGAGKELPPRARADNASVVKRVRHVACSKKSRAILSQGSFWYDPLSVSAVCAE